jgi:hypothetical protein
MSGASINRINLDGTGQTVIPNTSDAYGDINVSPTGDKLVYAGGTSNFQMFIIDTNGMNKTLWNNGLPNSIHQTGASWNTAGTIYFVLSNYGNAYSQKIYSKPDNDPAAVPVLLTPSFAHEPNSGGPNNLIIFNDLYGNLVTMNPDGSNQVVLSSASSESHARGAWHLSDSVFYYMHNNNIWKIKYNNTGNTQVTTTAGIERVIGFGVTSPTLTITASANPVCQGDTVTYTAQGLSALPAGTLQWYVNGLPVSGSGNLGNRLVAHYPFDGNLSDATGNCQNAVTYGNVSAATDRKGAAGHAFYIGGNSSGSDYLTVAHDDSLVVHNPFSVSVWINKEVHGGWIINKGRDIVNGYGIHDAGGNAQVNYYGVNGAGVLYTSVSLNAWHLYTFVANGDTAYFYLDGVLADKKLMSSNSYVSTSNDYPLAIGRHFTACCYNTNPSYYSYPFKGRVDDFRLYSRPLTAYEAWLLYSGSDTSYTYIPQNGDTVYCVYTSAGSPTVTDTSNFIVMSVNPLPADIGESTISSNLSQGLAAWYPFNGNANDESGNGNNGAVIGCQLFPDRLGNNNGSYFFNGNDNLIRAENSPSLNIQNSISLSAWFKTDDPDINHNDNESSVIIAKARTHYSRSYSIFFADQSFSGDSLGSQLFETNNAYYPNIIASNYWNNEWHLISSTYDYSSGISKIFIDGQLKNTLNIGQVNLMQTTVPLTLGCYLSPLSSPYRGFYHGALDDIRIYNRAITSEEILCLYNGSCNNLAVEFSSDSICTGSSTTMNLIHSQTGIQYQLLKNGINFGTAQTGNGNTIIFPITGLAQTSTFTIHALNPTTGCNLILDTIMTVTVVPFVPSTSPDTTVCSGNNVTLQAFGGSNYLWSNGMTTPTITVSPMVTSVYYVTVTTNEGCSGTDSVHVAVNSSPMPTVSGPNSICMGTNNAIYTTQPGMSNYTWTISTGGTITAGAGTNTIIVTWTTLGAQTVSVNYANALGCTALVPTTLAVTVNPMAAPTVTGSTGLCVNSGYYYYSTEPGMNNYQWSVSPGATIIWGNGTPDLIVTWDQSGAQWVKVNYTNSSGCTAVTPTQYDVTVNPLPGAAGIITGPNTVCAGSNGVTYSTTLISNTATYVWSLPPGASIVSGAGTNSILVDFDVAAQPGSITVYGNNLCGNGTVSPALAINVGALPGLAGQPTGESYVCEGDTGVIYYVSPIFNATTCIWEITGGGIITAGHGTYLIRVRFPMGTTACDVTVFGANACGAGLISPAKQVTVNPIPETPVIAQNGEMLVSSAPVGNQWSFNGLVIPNATQQTLTPTQSGSYSVMVTLEGCRSHLSDAYYYIMTGINMPANLQVSVYPVPNNGLFKITLSGNTHETTNIRVMNGLGILIHEQSINAINDQFVTEIDLRPVAAGVYTVVVESGDARWARKVVVTK